MMGLIIAGENTGCLAAALRRVAGRRDFFPPSKPADSIFDRWYPVVLLCLAYFVVQALLLFSAPKLGFILGSFQVPIPTSLAALRQIPLAIAYPGFLIAIAAGLSLAIFCGRMLSQVFTPHGVTLGPIRPALDAMVWYTPIVGGMVRNRAMADVCYMLASALSAGQPQGHAIIEASAASGNYILRRRMRKWARGISAGGNIADASRKAGLPRIVGELLQTTGDPRYLPQTFRFLCQYYDGRSIRSAKLLRRAAIPVMTIVGGAIVVGIALSVYQPLVALINKLTGP
jgi:type II secretory pathway component PulF